MRGGRGINLESASGQLVLDAFKDVRINSRQGQVSKITFLFVLHILFVLSKICLWSQLFLCITFSNLIPDCFCGGQHLAEKYSSFEHHPPITINTTYRKQGYLSGKIQTEI